MPSIAQIAAHPAFLCALLLTASNVFMPFAVTYMSEPLKLDDLWAAFCILGAVYFTFRG